MRSQLALILLTMAACGDAPVTPPPTPPNPLLISFDTNSYTLKAGEEVKYLCYTTRLAGDVDPLVTQITPLYGQATHHLGVYYTLVDEPDGVFTCPDLVRDTWIPLYGGGVESGTLKAPDGAAFYMKKNQQILVQLHLLNASPNPVTDKATIQLLTTRDPNPTPAGMFGMTNTQIALDPSATGSAAMDCEVSHDLNVFAAFGHMHQLGTKITLSKTMGPVLFEESWDFNNQPTVPKLFQVKKGESLHLDCQYLNTTNQKVEYGESTASEMCSFALYYTPYTRLDGCMQ